MNFYTKQHKYYCGIDLHARKMYVCVLTHERNVFVHENIKTDPEQFLKLIRPYEENLIVGVECVFCWYRLADLCAQQNIAFMRFFDWQGPFSYICFQHQKYLKLIQP